MVRLLNVTTNSENSIFHLEVTEFRFGIHAHRTITLFAFPFEALLLSNWALSYVLFHTFFERKRGQLYNYVDIYLALLDRVTVEPSPDDSSTCRGTSGTFFMKVQLRLKC